MHSKRIREKVKRDYDSIASEFSETRQRGWTEFEVFRPYLRSGLRVLDVGCGNGRLLDFLKEFKPAAYVGVDQSVGLLKEAKRCHLGKNVSFKELDMMELSNLKGSFDVVFVIASFHHLPPEDQRLFLKRLKKLLAPEAVICMTNWNLWSWRFWKSWMKNLFWPKYGVKGLLIPFQNRVHRYYYAFTRAELRSLLQREGYSVLLEESGRNFVTVARL